MMALVWIALGALLASAAWLVLLAYIAWSGRP